VLSASVLDFVVWDGGLPFSGISRGCWLHTRGAVSARPGMGCFYLVFLVVWLYNFVFNKPFCS
jgi:hypothetical protein